MDGVEHDGTRERSPAYVTPRRAALTLALGAATTATLVWQAAGQEKISKALATYQGKPNGTDHCGVCNNFQAPKTCKFVQGEVSPNGWCQLFSPKT